MEKPELLLEGLIIYVDNAAPENEENVYQGNRTIDFYELPLNLQDELKKFTQEYANTNFKEDYHPFVVPQLKVLQKDDSFE